MLSNSLIELDRAHLVHPVASYRGHEAAGVRVLKSAKGATVTDVSGHQLVDGFAGLWCVNAGYGHESIVAAAARQMQELPYATGYFSLGSEPAIRLAAELAPRAPGDLNHVYFTLGGSDAVDRTVRFIRYYWHARREPQREHFISIEHGYHGSSTVGAGLTALPAFHAGFGLPLSWQHTIPSHYVYRNPAGEDGDAIIAASLAALDAKIEEIGGPQRVAAFYAEPIQGSGGVLVSPKGWMKAMCARCKAHGILFVADEVITGFGRTGPLFACSDDDIVPDLMTVAKGLTSGYVPMGAVFMSDHVYDTIADAAGSSAVGHGYTYSAHPVSAAVGLEVLRLYESGLLANGAKAGARLMAGLQSLRDHPLVGDVRGRGMLAAIELVTDKQRKTPLPAAAEPAHLRARLEEWSRHPGFPDRSTRLRAAAFAAPSPRSTPLSSVPPERSTIRWPMPKFAPRCNINRHAQGGGWTQVRNTRNRDIFAILCRGPRFFRPKPRGLSCETSIAGKSAVLSGDAAMVVTTDRADLHHNGAAEQSAAHRNASRSRSQ